MLPMSDTMINRDAISQESGCPISMMSLTIAPDGDNAVIVVVRCSRPGVPVAEILRSDAWDDSRKVPYVMTPCSGPCVPTGGL